MKTIQQIEERAKKLGVTHEQVMQAVEADLDSQRDEGDIDDGQFDSLLKTIRGKGLQGSISHMVEREGSENTWELVDQLAKSKAQEKPSPQISLRIRGEGQGLPSSSEIAEALAERFAGTCWKAEECAPFQMAGEQQASIERLAQLFEELGLEEDALDELTHQNGGEDEASQANNDGIEAQIEFLLDNGYTEQALSIKLQQLADEESDEDKDEDD